MHWTEIPSPRITAFQEGIVIPAQPLALNSARQFDPVRQRALSRYYMDAGAGGLAVGVHTTQFAIRDVGLYAPVLETASEAVENWCDTTKFMIAGVAGKTDQAIQEAKTAKSLGYQSVLVSMAALNDSEEADLIDHCTAISKIIPIIGFYLQKAVGGRYLSRQFWKSFAEIDNVIGIKMAPFNRYATLDVIRGVVEAKAEKRITLYTGNDDHIVLDLISTHQILRGDETVTMQIAGGLLGHWSVWTSSAVRTLELCKKAKANNSISAELMSLDSAVTDCNAVVFDVVNNFEGVIAGCHEILRRQGLLEGRWCLDEAEDLGPGQNAEIDRIYREYPQMNDDAFIAKNLHRWLS